MRRRSVGQIVAAEDVALGAPAVARDAQLVRALAEAEQRREQQRAREQPARRGHGDRDGAAQHAQQEARRDAGHVDERDLLERERVEEVEREVGGGRSREGEARPERRRARERDDAERARRGRARRRARARPRRAAAGA